ncbi:MAG TPA: hypothetical protein VK746_04430 [Candidatus Eisenbacteria bacterium]|nr:hypothetical protein [Candidatus Eisenbacteria bacterium]
MAITFHKDSTLGLGKFIQVLARGRPIGRIFHVNNIYRFSPGDEAQRGEADLQDEDDLEELKDKILAKYSAGGRA